MPTTRLRDVPALQSFLYDLPLFFWGSIYGVVSCPCCLLFGGPDSTYSVSPVQRGALHFSNFMWGHIEKLHLQNWSAFAVLCKHSTYV